MNKKKNGPFKLDCAKELGNIYIICSVAPGLAVPP